LLFSPTPISEFGRLGAPPLLASATGAKMWQPLSSLMRFKPAHSRLKAAHHLVTAH
jgi:hypothetical protein